jgi:NosR/NirI family transcriptional regulator, nitrous oxide reductase regulator
VTPRANIWQYIDTMVLAAALFLSAYLVLKKRSRRAVFALMIFSLCYFGFWRRGCVCSVGALQNVLLSVCDSTYVMPITILLFFILPLLTALFFGRVFCGAVCPLGAIQDFVLLKPVRVPYWLEHTLRLFAYLYLGLAILFVATGSAFIICRYDPFIAFYRLSGGLSMIVVGGCVLLLAVFVGRPYCRFLCPYGTILRQLSRITRWKVTICPDKCINCGLCERACPFGAIKVPASAAVADVHNGKKTATVLLAVVAPVLMFGGGLLGLKLGKLAAMLNPTVNLAQQIYMEEQGAVSGTTDAVAAFRATARPVVHLYAEAEEIQHKFKYGSVILGVFIGLVGGIKLAGSRIRIQVREYTADPSACLSCGRCYQFCPRQKNRLKNTMKKAKLNGDGI